MDQTFSVCSPLLDSVQHHNLFQPLQVGAILAHFLTVCMVYILFLVTINQGIPLDIIFNFIVETLNYANIMSKIAYK